MEKVSPELYPFAPHWFETSGGRIHYVDEGDPTREPMLMLHGNPTWSFYYRDLIRAFRGSHRVIAPDHLGCGRSDKPQNWAYTLENHITNVEALVLALDLKNITLIVHDWGGAIGMGFATRHKARIKQIVVLNTAAFSGPKMPFLIRLARIPGFGPLALRGFGAFVKGALATCAVHDERLTPEVRAGYLAPYNSWANRIANLRFVEDIPMSPAHPTWPVLKEIDEALPRLSEIPMLIVWGAKDYVFDDWFLAEWQRRFPKARVHRV